MSPRRSVAEAQATRGRILSRAAEIASEEGLDGITIGRLAETLEMSKSGVHKHFGTKESLQISTLDKAFVDFWHRVVEPALGEPPGLRRLRAVCSNSVDYLEEPLLPGGCLMTAALTEYDGRPGRVRDAVAEVWSRWREQLRTDLAAAVENAELPDGFDVEQALFEIIAAGLALNAAMQLQHDRSAADRARLAIERALSRP
ncbi:TetR family transcriptional regulator C-terminal domain-containing protein [Streptomyces globisporus]|uniref:TetR/AcrR family transcriptional regulator n=1 Tax=Streptomyces TaxID=1883 RepID=UPI00093CCE91|nr:MULTISPECIES: TetR/AcrR family transcriptional regulator [unclassified Streptomyces]MBK3528587.1 TetR/AcrR family transcriptional regulator [Streptomyces sp. MBT72]MBK3534909.1 TetR/AcrR family transcriptional regulator [Streptomyces sp. MBT67]MBK3548641.1 TetR/AcrR family transcriptional regulator [Streptomyces sp. MBT61]MBK6028126.1 TetR/AcrR family transcriptional regulator [Streptomyces sp. MBT59]OKJ30559.1 TetR family transcriptional regulator [Streptomyces sp. CB02130]